MNPEAIKPAEGWRPAHDDPQDPNVVWYDTGEQGFRLVLDPSLDATYREAVMSTEIELLRARMCPPPAETAPARVLS